MGGRKYFSPEFDSVFYGGQETKRMFRNYAAEKCFIAESWLKREAQDAGGRLIPRARHFPPTTRADFSQGIFNSPGKFVITVLFFVPPGNLLRLVNYRLVATRVFNQTSLPMVIYL